MLTALLLSLLSQLLLFRCRQGPKHLEEHWRKGYGGLRDGGKDAEEEAARLREMQARQVGGGWSPSLQFLLGAVLCCSMAVSCFLPQRRGRKQRVIACLSRHEDAPPPPPPAPPRPPPRKTTPAIATV
jgi:hypothetical protein